MSKPPARLDADSEEVTIAERWQCLITVCRDQTGAPVEVIIKMRDKAAKSGSDTELMAQDLGIAISRMLQRRSAATGE
jgi:hypothetical protein